MLKNNPNIASVERDTIVHARGHVTASDPNFSDQTFNYNAITIPGAWHFTTGDPSIIVAVVDTGIEWTHIDLSANIWSNDDSCTGGVDNDVNGFIDDCRGWNFVNSNNDPDDDNGHGTPVSGIIAAVRNNGIQGTGSAPNVTLMPLKALDSFGDGFNSDIIAAMNYAVDNGARIINLSLGSDGPCPASFQTALDNAFANNVLVVHAAGELGGTNRIDVEDSIASCNHVISVTSTDNLNQSTSYDDWVDSIDLAAPGGDVANVDNPITLGISSTFLGNTFDGFNFGTSFAAPHVSGCAALVYSVNPTLTFDEAEAVLETTALDLTDSGKTINLASVGKDKVFGHGLLQCGAAVAVASVSCAPPGSGDWTLTSSCTMTGSATAPANVIVQSPAVLTIPNLVTLTIDKQKSLTVQSGAGVSIKSGGGIKFETILFSLSSNSFSAGGPIPTQFTCDGTEISPNLNIQGVPVGTQSMALIMEDLDTGPPTFTHWLMWNIPTSKLTFAEDETITVSQGTNDVPTLGYAGPCPPLFTTHNYLFTLYALDNNPSLAGGSTRAQLESVMTGHIIDQTTLTGHYFP